MKKDNKIKIFTITLITAIIMAVSSITIYSNVCAPKFYDYFIDTGVKYLMDGKYEEAILVFNKAIEIEEKSTEARVYLAKGYVGNNEPDKAIEVLEEAQNLDITNEELLKQILEILNEIDSDIAYEFLDRFINAIGKDNLSDDINKILNSATQSPSIPVVDPAPGTYIKPISIKLKLDEIKVGHSFYYTTDGSDPNKNSQKYRGKIDIDKSTTIKLIGYNKNDESTEIITLDYIIDNNILNDINKSIAISENLINNTEVGTNIGNCVEGSKEQFKLELDKIKDLLNKDLITYEDAISIENEVNNAINKFKDNIIEETDKSKLKNVIDKAQDLYNKSQEGNKESDFKVGSKQILLDSINKSKKVLNDILSKQNDIDNEVNTLNNAISKFENSKNVNLKDLGLKYKNRLDVLKNQYEYFSSWPDSLSHMEVDNKISETYYKYDKLLSEMYSDLNKYLVGSQDSKFKKEQMNWSMEKKSIIQEYESLMTDPLMSGANIGSLESNLIYAINNHCYNLISIFMS